MAELQKKPSPAAPGSGSIPGVSAAKTKKPSGKLRAARGLAKVTAKAGAVVPGPWAKALSVASGIATSVIERKMAAATGTEAPAPAPDSAPAQAPTPTSGGTEAKLTALLSGGGGGGVATSAGAIGAVAVGSKLIRGVLVSPEPYDSEMGPRLAVAARVFGAANALELAVSRLIDLPAGQLLTFVMNRGYR